MEEAHRISMKLKCRIHEQDYDIVTGATFSEEYNETLDSGTIIIDQYPKILGLRPYDDVYIWNSDQPFYGYINVGDTVPLSNLTNIIHQEWPQFYGSVDVLTIQDTELTNNMPYMFSSGADFYSYTYEINGNLYPCLIDIWASNFLYGLDLNVSTPRWDVPEVIIQLALEHNGTTVNGSYSLPRYQEGGVSENGMLILTKHVETGFVNDSDAPDTLYVQYNLIEPFWARITVYPIITSKRLTIYPDAVSTNLEHYVITAISKPYAIAAYAYTYNMDSFDTRPVPRLSFSIGGNLNKAQVLGIRDIRFKVSAQGYSISVNCEKPTEGINDSVVFHFKRDWDGGAVGSEDGFDITLTKDSNNNWSCSGAQFYIQAYSQAGGEDYLLPVDKIVTDPNEYPYIYFDTISTIETFFPRFYKHLLIDSFTCERLDLVSDESTKLYKYKINLMSETKRLEKTILPNVSITQPIVGQKRSIWYYLNQFVDLYSPKVKFKDKNNKWVYKNKYRIDARLIGDYFVSENDTSYNADDLYINIPVHEIFNDEIYAPEMSLSAPTLRELISRLMIVKDCIPIVKNDVIYAMKISEIHDEFKINEDNFSFITESMNSSNYSTSFRREYGGAISQKDTAHMVEFLGFRTTGVGNGVMTLSNMMLETRFPIYKVNKLYMCYFRKATMRRKYDGTTYDKLVLVKQDITKLVLQNTVRNALPSDWTIVQSGAWQNITIDEMATHRIFTVGYNIGSNIISGWGDDVHYISDLLGWTEAVNLYVELIFRKMNNLNAWGVNQYQFIGPDEEIINANVDWKSIISPNSSNNVTDKLKGLFFEMDYTAMYSGAIIHSKENTEDDDIQSPDNCSSALSILEADGLFEREKANRLANKEISFIARFDSVYQMNDADHNNVIGTEYKDEDETAVIYHREYQIYDDCVLANFAGTHDYVLKNYFTTVFAKYRTYSYAGYDENVNRAETDKYLVFLSDDRCYYEDDDNGLKQNIVSSVLSAFSESVLNDNLNIEFPNQINGGYFTFTYGSLKKEYFSDVNQFVAGYSLCFNIKMYDNMTNGNYIKQINCYDDGTSDGSRSGIYIGSLLEWHKMPISETDGFVKNVECYFGHFEEEDFYKDFIEWHDNTDALYSKIFNLPLKSTNPTFVIGKAYDFCKDNKEIIDFTLQYELINQDDNLIVSEWLMKLTDFSNYVKFSAEKTITDMHAQANGFTAKFWSKKGNWNLFLLTNGWYEYDQGIRLIFSQASVEQDHVLQEGTSLVGTDTGNIYYATSDEMAFGGEGSSYSSNSKWDLAVELNRINSVTVVNGEITRINVKVVLNGAYSSTWISNGVPGSYHESRDATVDIDLQRDLNASGYEFVYIGRLVPSSFISDWGYRSSFRSSYNSESNALTKYGSVVFPGGNSYNFPKTMYVLVSSKKMEQSFVYEQLKIDDLPDYLKIVDTSENGIGDGNTFEDVFKIEVDDNGRPYIKYHAIDHVAQTDFGVNYESAQYWYYDVEGDGYLHFVFGINTHEKDSNGNDILITDKKIYISTLKNRGTMVYNNMHRECGAVMNFAESENADKYGAQFFVPRLYDEEE